MLLRNLFFSRSSVVWAIIGPMSSLPALIAGIPAVVTTSALSSLKSSSLLKPSAPLKSAP